MSISRRKFLGVSAITGASLMVPWKFGAKTVHAAGYSPNLTKWIQPLRGLTALGDPGGIPVLGSSPDPVFANTNMFNVTAGEFTDLLHPQLLPTKLWGYWDTNNPVKRHLGGLVVGRRGTASRLRFTNMLPAQSLIPVDTTIPGANQAQNRIAIHLHGGYVPWLVDGGPFDWWSPTGASGLSFLNGPGSILDNIPGRPMVPGQADFYYPNNQSARLMWYHDHAYGITRTNAYAGLATGYLLLDAVNDAYVAAGKIPGLGSTIPLIFQDKKFVDPATIGATDPTWGLVARPDVQTRGSLWYEHVYDPAVFLRGPSALTLPNPSVIPEFFGDTMLTNGTVYPLVTVEAKRYRFLILNACNARFLNCNLLQVAPGGEIATNATTLLPVGPVAGPPIIQIGNEAGFLVTETSFPNNRFFNPLTNTGNLLMGPAERADVIIDFTGKAGNEYMLYNDASGPFPVGVPINDYFLGNTLNPVQPLAGTGPDTRQILRFKVVPLTVAPDPQPAGPILNPATIDPPLLVPYTRTAAPIPPLTPPRGARQRFLTLNEDFDTYGRLRQQLGTLAPVRVAGGVVQFGRDYIAPATELPAAGATEVWHVFNLTADTHPIHFHLVNVQVLSRRTGRLIRGVLLPTGVARGPEPNEVGWKETVQMHPGEITSVVMKFDLPPVPFAVPPSPRTGNNEYVWHCHILEHEEHDMMRPVVVSGANPISAMAVSPLAQTVTATGAAGPQTVVFNISGGAGTGAAKYIVTSNNLAYPATKLLDLKGTMYGFSVTVPAGALAATVLYTITDSAAVPATATATLKIV